MKKQNLSKPVTRKMNGVTITFTSKSELEAYDEMLRKKVEENRKKSGNTVKNDGNIIFNPDFNKNAFFNPNFTC